MSRCKACRKQFTPTRPLQSWCSYDCAAIIGMAAAAKKAAKAAKDDRRQTRAQLEAIKTLPMLTKEAREAFHKFVRLRDRKAGYACICCGEPLRWDVPGGATDAGHFRSVGSAPHLRFDERNVHAQRSRPCNKDLGGRPAGYRIGLIDRIGLEAVEALEADQVPRKYTRDELREIRDRYRRRAKELDTRPVLPILQAYQPESKMSKSQSAETSNIEASALRQTLRAEFGARRYRITKSGEVHVFGKMPNANAIGWWLYGQIDDTTTLARLGFQ